MENSYQLRTSCVRINTFSYEHFISMLKEMSPFEREEIYKNHYFPDQFAALLSYYEVKKCVQEHFSPATKLYLQKDCFGRPRLQGWMGDISLSHTDGCILIGAVNQGKIGVDIQRIEPVDEGVEHIFLSEKEKAHFYALSDEERTKYLFVIWTLKEAILKWTGTGFLVGNPTDITITLDRFLKEVTDIEGIGMTKVKFKLFTLLNRYQAAVCYSDLGRKVELSNFEHDCRFI